MEPAEPSLDLLALADLRPGVPAPPDPQPVDKDSLDEFLRACAPSLELGGRVTFQEFRDFRPERLAERVPAAATLLAFRRKLAEAAEGKATAAAVREAMGTLGRHPELVHALQTALERPSSPRPPAPTPKPPAGASVFDLVDAGPSETADAKAAVEGLIGELLGSPGGPASANTRKAAELVDRSLAPLLLGVLHHPAFLELEAAWRGLRHLVRSVDFRAGTRLHVIPVGRPDLARAVRDIALPFAGDRRSQGRTPLVLLDFTLDDADEAAALAEAAAAHSVPVAAAGSGPPASRWLALAANRFLARLPYGKDGDPVKGMAFEEESPRAWARTTWLLGALVAGSSARTGWGVDFTGPAAAEDLEPLPAAEPLEVKVSEPRARELGDAGVIAFACRPNSDRPFAATGGTFRQALFAAQIAASVERILAYTDPSRGLDEIARTVGAALQLLGLTPEGQVFSVTATPSKEGRPSVHLVVRPAGPPLRGLPELTLDVPIPLL